MAKVRRTFYKKISRVITVVLAVAVGALWSASASAVVIPDGTVMAGTGSGKVSEYTQTGTLITQLDTTTGSLQMTGSTFDTFGNFFTTDFQANNVTKFDPTGTLIGAFGSGYNLHPESIIYDAAGNFYVGQADGSHPC